MKWKEDFVTRQRNVKRPWKRGFSMLNTSSGKSAAFRWYTACKVQNNIKTKKSIESSRQMLHQSIDHQWRMNSQERHIYWREKSCGMWQDVRCRRCSESLKNVPSLLQTVLLNFVRSGLCVVLSWTLSLTQSYHPPLYPMIKHFVRTSSVMRILLFCQ